MTNVIILDFDIVLILFLHAVRFLLIVKNNQKRICKIAIIIFKEVCTAIYIIFELWCLVTMKQKEQHLLSKCCKDQQDKSSWYTVTY